MNEHAEIRYWMLRTEALRKLRGSPDTLLLLAKHLELETGGETPVEYLQFVIDQCIADEMEQSAKVRMQRAQDVRLHGEKS